MGPQIPYANFPELPIPLLHQLFGRLDPITIKPFGALVATGVYIGSWLAVKRAKERGFDIGRLNDFIFWSVGMGFVGGHVLDAIFYHPTRVMEDPLYLLKLWDGLSSFGGFMGALIGALLYKWRKREDILPYAELVLSAFPVGWLFGRLGCASVHDHPGRLSDAWYAVQYPGLPEGMGRLDLGLYEALLTIPFVILSEMIWRRGARPIGSFLAWICMAYAPIRFGLDFLREEPGAIHGADPRYAGLTPAQWACFGLFGVGLYFLRYSRTSPLLKYAEDAAAAPAAAEPT